MLVEVWNCVAAFTRLSESTGTGITSLLFLQMLFPASYLLRKPNALVTRAAYASEGAPMPVVLLLREPPGYYVL